MCLHCFNKLHHIGFQSKFLHIASRFNSFDPDILENKEIFFKDLDETEFLIKINLNKPKMFKLETTLNFTWLKLSDQTHNLALPTPSVGTTYLRKPVRHRFLFESISVFLFA